MEACDDRRGILSPPAVLVGEGRLTLSGRRQCCERRRKRRARQLRYASPTVSFVGFVPCCVRRTALACPPPRLPSLAVQVIEKMVTGRLRKYYKDSVLLEQECMIGEEGGSVADVSAYPFTSCTCTSPTRVHGVEVYVGMVSLCSCTWGAGFVCGSLSCRMIVARACRHGE